MAPLFTENAVYQSKTHGFVRYVGIDTYYGETTFKFYSVTHNQTCYWKPESLNRHFDEEQLKLEEQ